MAGRLPRVFAAGHLLREVAVVGAGVGGPVPLTRAHRVDESKVWYGAVIEGKAPRPASSLA